MRAERYNGEGTSVDDGTETRIASFADNRELDCESVLKTRPSVVFGVTVEPQFMRKLSRGVKVDDALLVSPKAIGNQEIKKMVMARTNFIVTRFILNYMGVM